MAVSEGNHVAHVGSHVVRLHLDAVQRCGSPEPLVERFDVCPEVDFRRGGDDGGQCFEPLCRLFRFQESRPYAVLRCQYVAVLEVGVAEYAAPHLGVGFGSAPLAVHKGGEYHRQVGCQPGQAVQIDVEGVHQQVAQFGRVHNERGFNLPYPVPSLQRAGIA